MIGKEEKERPAHFIRVIPTAGGAWITVVGGFLIGFSLRGGVIIGLVAAAVVYVIFWWTPT